MQDAPSPDLSRRPKPGTGMQVALLLVALALLWISAALRGDERRASLELELSSTTPGTGQVFVLVDGAFKEEDSTRFPLVSDGEPQVYVMDLPDGGLPTRIRVDPGTGPGRVLIHRIAIDDGRQLRVIEGDDLREAIALRNQMVSAGQQGAALALESTGDDPHFEFAPPPAEGASGTQRELAGIAGLLMLSAAALLAWLLWLQAPRVRAVLREPGPGRRILLALAAAAATWLLLSVLGTGCDEVACSPRGLRYGSALFMAAIGFAAAGAATFRLLGFGRGALPTPGFFAAILAGQVTLVAYIYVRSALHAAVGFLPLTRVELGAVAIACAAFLAWTVRRDQSAGGAGSAPPDWEGLLVKLGVLAAICLVVADRELPRLTMLSSDPDIHAFLARQVERMGGIYRSQGDWGTEPLGYPGGTASMIFAWASLSWLAVGNALAAIPLLVTLLASLAVGEASATRVKNLPSRTLVHLTAVGVTVAALLLPLYTPYAHLEGAGRQMSIGTVALLAVYSLATFGHTDGIGRKAEWRLAVLAVPALFLLAVLNPVNVVVPSLLVASGAAVLAVTRRRVTWWLLVPLACPVLLWMDPYYASVMSGREAPQSIMLSGDYTRMSMAEVVSAWFAAIPGSPRQWFQPLVALIPQQGVPAFAILATALAVALTCARVRPQRPVALAAFAVLACIGIYLTDSLFQTLVRDSRFYLLPAYLPFSFAQYKGVLLIGLAAAVPVALWATGRRLGVQAAGAALLVALFFITMRPFQPMHLDPRHDYCGTAGCVQSSDLVVIERLEEMVASGEVPRLDGQLPRVLVPNIPQELGDEQWIFPTGASRYLALSDALPVAFFYFQGDADYGTENYRRHVCERLDRDWLARERIHYVFLPAQREWACLAGMDSLPSTDTIVASSGDSLLIRLDLPGGAGAPASENAASESPDKPSSD